MRSLLLLGLVLGAWAATAAAQSNVILDYNQAAQAAVRDAAIPNQLSAKIYAVVHLAQLRAISTVGASEDPDEDVQAAAAAYAGHAVLNLFFPWRSAKIEALLKSYALNATDGFAEEVGHTSGVDTFKTRVEIGFYKWASWYTSADTANALVGEYVFVPGQTSALYPQLTRSSTFVLKAPEEIPVDPPYVIPSPEYTEALREVFVLGRKSSAARSAWQTDTAHFWADGNLTSSVTGHFNTLAQAVVPPSTPLQDAAALFALLNIAVWDASVLGWKAKYDVLFWRPITAVRDGDGTNADLQNATWTPELSTPGHPEYPSGHSISAGAAAGVLANFFGTDQVSFSLGTEYPGLPARSYTSFTQAVDEVNDSRIWGGIHFRKSVTEGAALGQKVADYVQEYGQPRPLTRQGFGAAT